MHTHFNNVILDDAGLLSYKIAWDYQQRFFDEIVHTKIENRKLPDGQQQHTQSRLILCEHPHVYTLGKSGHMSNLLLDEQELQERNIAFYKTSRGGDITYHGPGQIVGYPILDLDNFFTDIHLYLRKLEEVMILTLADWGIAAGRYPGYTGVWLDPDNDAKARKICAMGVKCSRWVTMHGWAFNVHTDMDYFKHIIPCGIEDKAVTSMEMELGARPDMEQVKSAICKHFEAEFNCRLL